MIDKTILPTKLLWIDLEMTGLDPAKDVILEVAAIITDFDFKVLDSYEARIKHDKQLVETLFAANDFYSQTFTANRDDFLGTLESSKPEKQVEKELIDFTLKHFSKESAIIAGNSIHNDRTFIKAWWQDFDKILHYRMLDVTSWKTIMESKFGVVFEKKELHKALGDIQESIDELKYYLEWFNTHKTSQS